MGTLGPSPAARCRAIQPAPAGVVLTEAGCVDAADWDAVRRWRVRERKRLNEARRALPLEERRRRARDIAARLGALEVVREAKCLGFFWPLPGEPDLRPFITAWSSGGGLAALPVIVAEAKPLIFRTWSVGTRLRRQAVWGIPVPASGRIVSPDVVLVPLLGFDASGHRLGNGGGYYDRTFASLEPQPVAIGTGFSLGGLCTIYPQPHDVPMDIIVTERETRFTHPAGQVRGGFGGASSA